LVIMGDIVENLKLTYILRQDEFFRIKDYIGGKYPHKQSGERAYILADVIHRVIDRHIEEFSQSERIKIRINLLEKVLNGDFFEIRYNDILDVCLQAASQNELGLEVLSTWLNRVQPADITAEDIKYSLKPIREVDIESPESINPAIIESRDQAAAFITKPVPVSANILPASPGFSSEDIVCFCRGLFNYLKQTVRFKLVRDLDGLKLRSQSLINFTDNTYRMQLKPLPSMTPRYIGAVSIFCLSLALTQPGLADPPNRISSASSTRDKYEAAVMIKTETLTQTYSLMKEPVMLPPTELPSDLRYTEIDREGMKAYLRSKNSILADDPYFTEIIQASKEYNLNPLLLFAIAGQEQSFVPRDSSCVDQIANNPFNVGGSWQLYNTVISDSARIAAGTIVRLSGNRPADIDPLLWINRKYAEDQHWWQGVTHFIDEMKQYEIASKGINT